MKKFFFFSAALLLLNVSTTTAQTSASDGANVTFEGGVSLNAMNCLTDIGGNKGIGKKFFKDLNVGYSQIGVGLFGSMLYKDFLGLRLEGTLGSIAASDRVLDNVTDIAKERFNRNQSFRSKISEIALMIQVYPLNAFSDRDDPTYKAPLISPYILGGVGYYSFNPQGEINGRRVDLQPLHLEGQGFAEFPNRKNYKLSDMNFPVGLGAQYQLTNLINLKAEFVYRFIDTDYLDDVSTTYINPTLYDKYLSADKAADARILGDQQIEKRVGNDGKRGSPKNDDAYFSFNIKAAFDLGLLFNK